tara:strand:+ start:401 stop:1960 length:1560 start_codon:yes stop_codon:yes gene_type:complete
MANTIQLKRGTGSSVPSSLAEGELAINLDSGKLFYGSGSSVLSDFKVDTLTAETYVISSSVTHMTTSFSSGSTAFGDSAGDAHTFTGDITASGDISASGNVYAADYFDNGTNISSIYQSTLTFGIADTNVLRANANVVDNDFLRVDGTSIEGRSSAQVLSDIGAQPGIGDEDLAISMTAGLQDALNLKATIASPTFTGTIAIPNIANVETAIAANTAKETNVVQTTITGNAGTATLAADATTLATPRAINGVDFDGSAPITVTASGSTLSDTVTVAKGGTGLTTVASNTILTGNGTSALTSEANLKFSADRVTIGNSTGEVTPMIRFQNDENVVNVGISKTSNNLLSGDVDGDFVINCTGDHNILFGQNNAIAFTIDTNGDSNLNRRFTVTGDTDGTHEGDVVYFGGTTSMVVGTIYHYKSDGTWEVANANAVATSDGLLGVALGAASDTNGMLLRGMVTLDHDPGSVGDVLYLSNTNGDASATAPSDSNDIVRVIGYCLHASNGQIWFNPDSTFVEIA